MTDGELEAKKRRLEDIEAEAMMTGDMAELDKLYTEYTRGTLEVRAKRRPDEGVDGGSGAKRVKEDAENAAETPDRILERPDGDIEMGSLEVNQDEEFVADEWVFDELSGQWLDAEKVTEGRREEIEHMEGELDMFIPATWEECMEKTGRPPITTKWVDVNKGTPKCQVVRSRLVARDFKHKGESARFDLFAAMPPLEAKRMLLRMAIRRCRERPNEKYKLMFIDVKKAHLNGMVPEDEWVFVVLPPEAGGGVARLRRWLYGMRPAARAWEDHYATKLVEEAGFRRGVSAPTVFWHPEADVSLVVHGDDFTALGPETELRKFEKNMGAWYKIKTRGVLGPEPLDDKEITILNRKLVWRDGLLTYEADPRIVETILKAMGLEDGSKTLDSPIVVESSREAAEEDEELSKDEATKFRSTAALANYLALDRPDLQVAVSVLCQKMASPTRKSWMKLKRVARYLKKYPVLKYEYKEEERDDGRLDLRVFSDSDWAGCKETRRSRSGGVALLAGCPVKSWSNRQATPAMSSGEAEYYAVVKAAAEALGVQALALDMGFETEVAIYLDANAAKAIASRSGVGKVRHMEVRYLWVQDAVARRRFTLKKIHGKTNPADVFTKPLSHQVVQELLNSCRFSFGGAPGAKARGEGGCRGSDTLPTSNKPYTEGACSLPFGSSAKQRVVRKPACMVAELKSS